MVLGNLEETLWSKSDVHTSITQKERNCLLMTMAVKQCGHIQKEGECKNALCNPILPDNDRLQAAQSVSQVSTGCFAILYMDFIETPSTGTRSS
jgi:hypothetical protein